ncbi:MAG: isochorismatase family protein, partial [Rubrivivax sp.]|nr:isochorismatase family protein [Rubrivivax sp.]
MTDPSVGGIAAGDALLVVDLQHDFLPGGALGVAHGDATIAPINRLIELFTSRGLPVFASRDWHPRDHCSFRERGGPWPVHCVAGSHGAAFTDAVHWPADVTVVSKATERDREAYSALDGTGLREHLQARGVRRVFVAGLATDYCVRATAADALALGLEVVVVRDAVAAVDVQPGDGERALADIRSRGGVVVDSGDL